MTFIVPFLPEPSWSYEVERQEQGIVEKVTPAKVSVWNKQYPALEIVLRTEHGKETVVFPARFSPSLAEYLQNKEISFMESDGNKSFYAGKFSKFYMIIDLTSPALEGVPRGLETRIDYH